MDPLNYQFADPGAAILNGVKLGAIQQQIQQQQQLQQAAVQQAMQQRADLTSLASNPSAGHADYAAMMTKYPALAENLGKAFKVMDEGQQKNLVNFQSRVYSAQLAGNNQLATDLLRERAKADPSQAQHYTVLADLIEKSPSTARSVTALSLAGAMGPDKFASTFQNLGTEARADQLQPLSVAEKTGQAQEALVKGGNAEAAAALGNQKTQEEILSAQAQRQVASFNAQIASANSETERGQLTLARDKFVAEQATKKTTAGVEAQQQFDTLTDSLSTARSLQADMTKNRGTIGTYLTAAIPGLDAGPGVGTTLGKVLSYVPGTDAKDFDAKLETLKSKQFLAQAQSLRGMGALSNAEGERIERAVASLDRNQSPQAFNNALGVIVTTLERGQAKLIAGGKMPTAGGTYIMRHPQYGNVNDGDIQRLMSQNPGTTREQVLDYLRSTGGK